jgi:hypothetical protein
MQLRFFQGLSRLRSSFKQFLFVCLWIAFPLFFASFCQAEESIPTVYRVEFVRPNLFSDFFDHGYILVYIAMGGLAIVCGLAGAYGGGIACYKLMKGQPNWEKQLIYGSIASGICISCLAFLTY